MVGMSSILPPAQRGPGVRPVQSVAGAERKSSRSQQSDAAHPAAGRERTSWRDRNQINGESFIDAEFVEVLRGTASTAKAASPIDENLRQALEAYRRAGNLRSILGAMIDIPT